MIPGDLTRRTQARTNRQMSDQTAESRTNATEYTVSEISGALKRTVEDAFGNVRVRGEISGYRGPHSSGHAYFSLKDDRAKIDAVVWRTAMIRLKFRPEEGMEVIATGKLTTYPGKSSYQIVIENLEPAGAGALMALLEERKRKLAAEGLFEQGRKRRLPHMPMVIGVVTSPTGAVIRDIIHRIKDRFPLTIIVWPVRVQGETCGAEVTAAVAGFNALPVGGPVRRPDVLIVARGGGSLEDLWGFNDEALARAVAASVIPVISAVGHETDWTLIDYVADRRAPTPTGAAEMAVPVKAELEATLAGLAARLRACTTRNFDRKRTALRAAARALPSPDQLLALPRRRFDEATSRLGRALDGEHRTQAGAVRRHAADAGDAVAAHRRGAESRQPRSVAGTGGAARAGARATREIRPGKVEARRRAAGAAAEDFPRQPDRAWPPRRTGDVGMAGEEPDKADAFGTAALDAKTFRPVDPRSRLRDGHRRRRQADQARRRGCAGGRAFAEIRRWNSQGDRRRPSPEAGQSGAKGQGPGRARLALLRFA